MKNNRFCDINKLILTQSEYSLDTEEDHEYNFEERIGNFEINYCS